MVDSEEHKLYVKGIPKETTDDTLRDYFGKYGDVISTVVAKDRATGGSRGFGFVCFSDHSAVDRALQDTHHVIIDRKVEVRKAFPKSEQHKHQQQNTAFGRNSRSDDGNNDRSSDNYRTKKIFVGGLSASLTEEEFKSYFERFGRTTDVVVMHDSLTKRPRGFGFITFDSEDSVDAVMRRNFHELCGKLVEVKKAVPKDVNNNNGNNGYGARMDNGRGAILNNYQHGDYLPYIPNYGFYPGYGFFPGYGAVAGFTYGANPFGAGFLTGGFSGISYGAAPFIPRSPWNGALPYGGPAVYPAYLNGGVGPMGGAAHWYNGFAGTGGLDCNMSQLSLVDSQAEADDTRGQIHGADMDVNISSSGLNAGLDQSCGAAASKEDQRGIDGRLRSYPVANTS